MQLFIFISTPFAGGANPTCNIYKFFPFFKMCTFQILLWYENVLRACDSFFTETANGLASFSFLYLKNRNPLLTFLYIILFWEIWYPRLWISNIAITATKNFLVIITPSPLVFNNYKKLSIFHFFCQYELLSKRIINICIFYTILPVYFNFKTHFFYHTISVSL